MRRLDRSAFGTSAVLVVAFAAYLAYDFGMVRFNNPCLSSYPIQGIDVSHHQGDIDWNVVASQPNVRFAFM
ncbi:glycosyl hydrolase, partial [Rhizobium brockwellii]